jgi:ATP-dependent Zn protease
VEMDGFNPSQIFVLAATNTYKDLDPAILRPGRFDQVLTLNLPDSKGRAQIIAHNLKDIQDLVALSVNISKLAAETIGFSGAELAQLVNQAKLIASSNDAWLMEERHFNDALRLTRFGPKRSLLMSPRDRERVAFHEAGHSVAALLTPYAMPVQSATIIPHASSLGMVVSVPGEGDSYFSSAEAYAARIDVSLAGWLAEELAFSRGQVSSGAVSDLQKANAIARHMVDAGFGARTGFLQPLLTPNPQYTSEQARQSYEEDVKEILQISTERVRALLKENEGGWRRVSEGLMEHETLSGAQLQMILDVSQMDKEEVLAK